MDFEQLGANVCVCGSLEKFEYEVFLQSSIPIYICWGGFRKLGGLSEMVTPELGHLQRSLAVG